MVLDIKAEDDLIELRFFNSDPLVAEWWRQLSQEVREAESSHIHLSHWIIFSPSILESFDVLLFEGKDVILIFRSLHVVEVLIDNSNKYIHEYEERKELED